MRASINNGGGDFVIGFSTPGVAALQVKTAHFGEAGFVDVQETRLWADTFTIVSGVREGAGP